MRTKGGQLPCGNWRCQYNIANVKSGEGKVEAENGNEKKAPSFFSVLGSVLASMFGVQSNRKREQDFTHGKPSQYIIIGLLMTGVFILTIWGLVSLVMKLSGV